MSDIENAILADEVAATLTLAAAVRLAGLKVDPTLADQAGINARLEVWETYRSYVTGEAGVLGDPKDWPVPPAEAAAVTGALGSLAPADASKIVSVLSPLASVIPAVGPIISVLTKIAGAATAAGAGSGASTAAKS